jgi:hypothetical protein
MVQAIILVASLLIAANAASQPQPEAPQVKTEQKSKSAVNPQDNTNQKPSAACESSAPVPISVTCVQANPSETKSEKSSEEGSEYWPPLLGYRVKVTDSLLALFTLGVWWATWRLVRGADKTAKHELRAYVGVEHVHIEKGEVLASPHCGKIVIRNFGKTMAKDMQIWINGVMADGEVTDFPLGDRKSKTVVMPNESIGGLEHEIPVHSNTAAPIYLWGRIEYKDVFKIPHWTKFRFVNYKQDYFPGTGGGGISIGWAVKTSGEDSNDAN